MAKGELSTIVRASLIVMVIDVLFSAWLLCVIGISGAAWGTLIACGVGSGLYLRAGCRTCGSKPLRLLWTAYREDCVTPCSVGRAAAAPADGAPR